MNYKKKDIMFFSIIIILCLCVLFTLYFYIGGGSKEIKAAKKFMGLVYSNDIVEKSEDKIGMSYKSMIKSDSPNGNDYYSVTTKNFGIDIDGNFNVIGFKNNTSRLGDINISQDKAKELANLYLEKIYKGEYKFKEFAKENSDAKAPYYTLIFTKYEDGYPYYVDQIMIAIDKNNGKMDGYSNGTSQGKPEKVNIKIDEVEAEKTVIESFSKLNKNGEIAEETYKAFCEDKDRKITELCYVVTIKGLDIDNKEVKAKYFISTNSGKILNFSNDNVSSTIS